MHISTVAGKSKAIVTPTEGDTMSNSFVTSTKEFVNRNKTKILTVAIVATSAIVLLQNHGIRSLNEFLEENDLYDEYYFPETE